MLYPIIRRQRRPLLPPEEVQSPVAAPTTAPVVADPIVEQPKTMVEEDPDVIVVTAEPDKETVTDDGALGERCPSEVPAEAITPDLTLVPEEQPATKGKRAKVSQNRKAEAE